MPWAMPSSRRIGNKPRPHPWCQRKTHDKSPTPEKTRLTPRIRPFRCTFLYDFVSDICAPKEHPLTTASLVNYLCMAAPQQHMRKDARFSSGRWCGSQPCVLLPNALSFMVVSYNLQRETWMTMAETVCFYGRRCHTSWITVTGKTTLSKRLFKKGGARQHLTSRQAYRTAPKTDHHVLGTQLGYNSIGQ